MKNVTIFLLAVLFFTGCNSLSKQANLRKANEESAQTDNTKEVFACWHGSHEQSGVSGYFWFDTTYVGGVPPGPGEPCKTVNEMANILKPFAGANDVVLLYYPAKAPPEWGWQIRDLTDDEAQVLKDKLRVLRFLKSNEPALVD